MKANKEAAEKGYLAYMKDIPRNKNPHPVDSNEYGHWLAGWFDGYDEDYRGEEDDV